MAPPTTAPRTGRTFLSDIDVTSNRALKTLSRVLAGVKIEDTAKPPIFNSTL